MYIFQSTVEDLKRAKELVDVLVGVIEAPLLTIWA